VVQFFEEQEACTVLTVKSDSNWAGDIIERKSTSCIQLLRGKHLLRQQVSTQQVQALSSGEAEFVALVKAGSLALGMKSLLVDMGSSVSKVVLYTDSTAAKGMCQRGGLGRVRHLDTGLLWIQNFVRDGTFALRKILGTENSADLGTKEVSAPTMWKYLKELGFQLRDKPHEKALKAAVGSISQCKLVKFDELD